MIYALNLVMCIISLDFITKGFYYKIMCWMVGTMNFIISRYIRLSWITCKIHKNAWLDNWHVYFKVNIDILIFCVSKMSFPKILSETLWFLYCKLCSSCIYRISSIRRLGVNQQIVYCVPGVKRSRGVNLNVEFCRRLECITSTPPGVKMSRGI